MSLCFVNEPVDAFASHESSKKVVVTFVALHDEWANVVVLFESAFVETEAGGEEWAFFLPFFEDGLDNFNGCFVHKDATVASFVPKRSGILEFEFVQGQ